MAAAVFSLCVTAPVCASGMESLNTEQPFQQALSIDLLRSLFTQAFDRFVDHVEISGNLRQNDPKADQPKSLRFKFYPDGKSKSDRHLSAEGWFRSAPDSGQLDWHFRFKLPEDQSKRALQQFDVPL